MNKFQIAEISGAQAHAGTKATEDVLMIARKLGFDRFSSIKIGQRYLILLLRNLLFYCSIRSTIHNSPENKFYLN